MFTSEAIQTRVRQSPFRPFRIVTSSGESYEVRHPDLILFGTTEVTIGTASGKSPSLYETQVRVSLLHITSLDDIPVPLPAGKNGQT